MENKEEKDFRPARFSWYPGHMLKTKRQIAEDLKIIDVVIEIVDARMPMSSQNPDVNEIIRNKKKVIVLNKSDLADEKETKKWIRYLKERGIPALAINAENGQGIKQVIDLINVICDEKKEKALNKGIANKNIRVMVIGIPNVGKSSFINRIANRKATVVGNKPGVTKQKQWVRLSNNIELQDTPGVLWPKFESNDIAMKLAYTGTIKDEILEKTDVAYSLLKELWNMHKNQIIERYKLTTEEISNIIPKDDCDEYVVLMELIAKKRGAIYSKGEVDYEKVANLILTDFRTGKLGRITLEVVEEF